MLESLVTVMERASERTIIIQRRPEIAFLINVIMENRGAELINAE